MIYPTRFTSRRPDPIAVGLRRTFQPVTEMTPSLEAAVRRLALLDLNAGLPGMSDEAFPGSLGVPPRSVWEPASRMSALAR